MLVNVKNRFPWLEGPVERKRERETAVSRPRYTNVTFDSDWKISV